MIKSERFASTGTLVGRTASFVHAFGDYAWAIGLAIVALPLMAAITPTITLNDGLGGDGVFYAQMARAFREQRPSMVEAPWLYRIFPSALVAFMPFDVRSGFVVLDALSLVGSAAALVVLLHRYGITGWRLVLAIVWWLALPLGMRTVLYYPVLTEALGFLLLLVLLIAALDGRWTLFALALVAAVLTRENLLMLVPFAWRANLRLGIVRATSLTALATLPAVAAFFLVRGEGWLGGHHSLQYIALILSNSDGHAWRLVLATPLSLGLLFLIPLVFARRTFGFFGREMHWTYFVGLAFIIAAIGGFDFDRYLYVLSPLLLILTFGVARELWSDPLRVAALTGLQLVAIRFAWPIGTMTPDYPEYPVGWVDLRELAVKAFVVAVVFATTVVLLGWWRIAGLAPRGGSGPSPNRYPHAR